MTTNLDDAKKITKGDQSEVAFFTLTIVKAFDTIGNAANEKQPQQVAPPRENRLDNLHNQELIRQKRRK